MAKRSLASRRSLEMLGLLMIGDGVLATVTPSRHALLWLAGPRAWRKAMTFLANRPILTRAAGAAELAAGLWIAVRQKAAA